MRRGLFGFTAAPPRSAWFMYIRPLRAFLTWSSCALRVSLRPLTAWATLTTCFTLCVWFVLFFSEPRVLLLLQRSAQATGSDRVLQPPCGLPGERGYAHRVSLCWLCTDLSTSWFLYARRPLVCTQQKRPIHNKTRLVKLPEAEVQCVLMSVRKRYRP